MNHRRIDRIFDHRLEAVRSRKGACGNRTSRRYFAAPDHPLPSAKARCDVGYASLKMLLPSQQIVCPHPPGSEVEGDMAQGRRDVGVFVGSVWIMKQTSNARSFTSVVGGGRLKAEYEH